MFACRLCRQKLSSNEGCGICLDFKTRNLVAVDEDDAESPALADVSRETVNALRAQIRRIAKILKDDPDHDVGTGRLIAAANTVAKVIESARKLQVDGVTAIQNMSFKERAQLFIDWWTALPPAYRDQVRKGMEAFELSNARPLDLPAGVFITGG